MPIRRIVAALAALVLTAPGATAGGAERSSVTAAGDRRPVVIVPGMGASANWSCFLFEVSCQDAHAWGWVPIAAQAVYQPLIDRLESAGYTRESGYLSVLFYDWRKPIGTNAGLLQERIAAVKAQTGATEVDVVGHSMGGLVGRAYVQGGSYAGDVAHLVTLGTPHYGAARTYPAWEAANFYGSHPAEMLAFDILLSYYMARDRNLVPVYAIRRAFPGLLDLAPTADFVDAGQVDAGYLYDERRDDLLRPESEHLHRNGYLSGLNADLDSLFSRTQVLTYSGEGLPTPARFYVHRRACWEWPRWDDGEPNWDREGAFLGSGDGTVLAASAGLPAPATQAAFPGVGHLDLPRAEAVVVALLDALGIPDASPEPPADAPGVLQARADRANHVPAHGLIALAVHGPAEARVIDPAGARVERLGATLPGAAYVSVPHDPYKLILVPARRRGGYRIEVRAARRGAVQIILFDTGARPPELVRDPTRRWDRVWSLMEGGSSAVFEVHHRPDRAGRPRLLAVTPVVDGRLTPEDRVAQGRARPGSRVELRDQGGRLLGTAVADARGRYSVPLAAPLRAGQRLEPFADGVAGPAATLDETARR